MIILHFNSILYTQFLFHRLYSEDSDFSLKSRWSCILALRWFLFSSGLMSKFVAFFLNVFVFMLTAIMSGITKEELVTILDEKLEEKFQRKFDDLKLALHTMEAKFFSLESLSTRRPWGHERLLEVIRATMYMLRMSWRSRGHVADARTPLFRLKVGRHNKMLWFCS